MEELPTKQDTTGRKRRSENLMSAGLIFISILLMIAFSELILYFLGYENIRSRMMRFSTTPAGWWINDSVSGPRYVAGKNDKLASTIPAWYKNRLGVVNNLGYHDKNDFTDIGSDTLSFRILFLGDSFTWGASSDLDSSYVEVCEYELNKSLNAVCWNAGIPATGTNYALFAAKKFMTLQHSDFVVLGFFENDFLDNLLPFDGWQFSEKCSCLNCYELDENLKANRIPFSEAYKNATGAYPIDKLNWFQRNVIIESRLLPLIRGLYKRVVHKFDKNADGFIKKRDEIAYNATSQYLLELKKYVENRDAQFVVLLIPARTDIEGRSDSYMKAVKLFRELQVNYIEVLDLLGADTYSSLSSDMHWNNKGHKLAGIALSKYILRLHRTKFH